MNDELLKRWRAGDAKAGTAVRNAVRSMAERVLSHPALLSAAGPTLGQRLRQPDRRRELTAEVAQEVMSHKAETAAQMSALALVTAGRHAVLALQENHPPTNEAHLPPPVAVTYALASSGLAPRVKEAAERHLEACPHCQADIRLVERIIRAEEVSDPESPPHQQLVEEMGHTDEVDQLFAALEADLRGGSKAGERPQPAAAATRPGPSADRPARRSDGRVLPGPSPQKRRSPLVYAVPLVLLIGLAIYFAGGGEGGDLLPAGPVPALATLADRSPPEVARISDLPPEVQFAVADLTNGDCRTAAGRFRSARRAAPDELRLLLLEGASFVCAGEAGKALDVFDEIDSRARDGLALPKAMYWYRAQAHLLKGDAKEALAALEQAVLNDPSRRKQADEQAQQIRAMLAAR